MTFTYDLENPNDITRVRFHIGDTNPDEAIFQDEEILFILAESGNDWKKATVACLRKIIAMMSATPDFTADWLKVDYSRALSGYKSLLGDKLQEFGFNGTIVGNAKPVYRSDSFQRKPPKGW
jgi:hypothetical protein